MRIDIFLIGLATIPFDNLPFAPSSGWAAISPIIFFVYCFMNLHLLVKVITRNHMQVLLYITGAAAFQFILLYIHGIHLAAFIDSLRTLVLGITFYFALIIRYQLCHADIDRDAEVLYKAYILSFLYGMVWLVMNSISLSSAQEIFSMVQKRTYPRLAYTFTEPSFISTHTIGVMFMFAYLVHKRGLAVKFVRLGIAFMAVSIINASSARCAADAALLLLLNLMRNLLPHSRSSMQASVKVNSHRGRRIKLRSRVKKGLVSLAMILVIVFIFLLSSRLGNVINKGANSDASMAVRWFRINASLKGFAQNSIETLAGWGMGNMVIPLRYGYNSAVNDFANSYTGEIEMLGRVNEVDSLFSLPIKLVSEWGLIITMYIFLYMLIRTMVKKIDIFFFLQICWLYVQTDSYCFYSMWLLLYLINYYDPNRNGVSFFDIIS